jgi:glucosamine--fructose-6-phosphate aminotransferase (isomerizing)
MLLEALESSERINAQIENLIPLYTDCADFLIRHNPYSTISIARGSSDHAAQFLNFLITNKLGKLTTSLSMSSLTLYKSKIIANQSAAFAISQSGKSPDIIDPIEYFKQHNSPTFAMVNDESSPLAKTSQFVIPLLAKKEESVAATKSFICSLTSSLQIVSHWNKDINLIKALQVLPSDLKKAESLNWSKAIEILKTAKRIMVVGRGYGLALALEAALKLKETCGIQAEAFSGAEIKHGPLALVESGYPILIFATRGPALHTLLDLATDLKSRGAEVILAAPPFVKDKDLEIQSTNAEELDIVTAIFNFYILAEELSRALGRNPDLPLNLKKVTETL